MTEYAREIPTWAWVVGFALGTIFISVMFAILVWFLKTFLEDNKESWKEIKNAVSNLVQVTTKHDTQIFELEKDVMQLTAEVRGAPFVDHGNKRRR